MTIAQAHSINEDPCLACTQVKCPLREAFIHGAHTKRCEIMGDIMMIDIELLSGLYIVVFPLKYFTACIKFFKNAWFWRFARKENISAEVLRDAVDHAENGLADADLGGGVTKQRIARPGESKSKGYRCAVMYRKGDPAFGVYGFAKSDLGNIRDE